MTALCISVSRISLLAHLHTGARFAGRGVLDLLLPPNCATCDQPVQRPGQLCVDCFRLTGFVSDPCCFRCGVPFPMASLGGAEQLCPACSLLPPVFGQARAALRYDKQSRRLILPLKHADRTDLVAALAPLMVRAGAKLMARADLLVPVPLHRRRLFQRRYNQAALLAHAIARRTRVPGQPEAVEFSIRTPVTPPRCEGGACGRICVLCISPALSQRVTSPTPQRLNALPLTTMNDPGGPSRRPSAGGAASVSEEENISASGDEATAVDNKLAVK